MLRKALLIVFVVFGLFTSYGLVVGLAPETVNELGREDGVVETMTAVFFLLAALLMIYMFFRSTPGQDVSGVKIRRNFSYLLLALFFFLCFGEEISWGQRIFGFKSPDWMGDINNQNEINLHNMRMIEASHTKPGIWKWATAGTVFTLFWFFYCLVIPLLTEFSPRTKALLNRVRLPLVPLWVGLCFLLNFTVKNLLEEIQSLNLPRRYGEFEELNYSFLFLVVCWIFLSSYKNKRSLG